MARRMKARAKTVQRMTKNGLVQENLGDNSSVRVSKREKDQRFRRKHHAGIDERSFTKRSNGMTRDAPDRRIYKSKYRKARSSVISENGKAELSVSLGEGKEKSRQVRSDEVIGSASTKNKQAVYRTVNERKRMEISSLSRLDSEPDEPLVSEKDRSGKETGKSNPTSKLYQKKRVLAESRGDSRKADTGGAARPKDKKRLQFAYEETGGADFEKAGNVSGKTKRNSREQSERYQKTDYFNLWEDKKKAREKKLGFETERKGTGAELKAHSRKEKVFREADPWKKGSKLRHGEPGNQKESLAAMTAGTALSVAKRKIRQEDDGNASVQGALAVSDGASGSVRLAKNSVRSYNRHQRRRSLRAQTRADKEMVRKRYQETLAKDENLKNGSVLRKQIQKARIKREYAKAKRMDPAVQGTPVGTVDYIKKVGGKVTNFFKENRKFYVSVGVLLVMMVLIMVSATSCSVLFLNNIVDYSGYSYMSTDQALRDAELYYTQLEANLQERINQMEDENGGYDSYRYNIGMIEHDPFILASYLSAKYGVFEFDDTIRAELDSIFVQQYQLSTASSTETITESRTVRVGESLGPVVTSAYCACSICCGQWSGGPTASGVYPTADHTLAVDANNPIVPMGTKVVMNGREYTVEDTGNFAQYGVAFDVYYDDHNTALLHGHQTWEAYLSDANGSQSIEVTSTSTQSVCSVTLTNASLSAICQDRLDEEQKEWFSGYNHVKGNLQMFETPLEYNWYHMVSSYHGYRIHPISGEKQLHNGMDIAAPEGTPVMAGLSGTVTAADYNDSYGNYVILEDPDGYEIRYAHLSSISVSAGAEVEKGEEIGAVGSTGNSTGAHLHLELLHNGERLNPIFYFETGEGSIYGDVEYSSEEAQRLCEYAVQFLGTPYVWGGFSPNGFDCSGFVSYCLTYSGVKNTGHQTTWGLMNHVTLIPESEMQPGDIIFFQGTYNAEPPTHVAIYLGNGQMVHSGHPNQITSISGSYWQQHWYCVGRW